MKQGVGQAFRHAGHTARILLRLVLTVLVVLAVGAGGLAWRLAEKPLALDWLTPRLERLASARLHQNLTIGRVALAWDGFRRGLDTPLEIHLTDLALRDANGGLDATVPQAVLSFSAGELVWGRIVPRALELDGMRLVAERQPDGTVRIGIGDTAPAASPPVASLPVATPPVDSRGELASLIQTLAQPAENDLTTSGSIWAQLQSVRLRDAGLEVRDRLAGGTWRAQAVTVTLTRQAGGGGRGEGGLTLDLGNQTIRADLDGTLAAGGDAVALHGHISSFNPAQAASLAPALSPLKALDAPLDLTVSATIGADLLPAGAKIEAHVGAGRVTIDDLAIPLAGADLEASGSMTEGKIHITRLALAPRPEAAPTLVHGDVKLRHDAGKITADLDVALDQIGFADLAAVWPAGLGGPGLQPWITGNITAGTAKNAQVSLHLVAPEDFSDADVTALSGGLDGEDLTASWLKPVPPLEHGNARLNFLSPEALEILVSGARQAGGSQGGLVAQNGKIRITGLNVHDQFLTLDADIGGPFADLVTLLRHPRLELLSRRPVNLQNPSGSVAGHLNISQLPLKRDLSVDEVKITSTGHLTRLHLSALAASADLDRGTLDYTVNNDGLKLRGSGDLGGIPSQFQAEMDFRDGGANQVLEKVTISARPRAEQLAALGMKDSGFLGGEAFPVQIVASTRRNGRGEAAMHADLRDVGLDLADLNFRKPAGQAASADLHIQMDHDRMTALDSFGVEGDRISVAGSVRMLDGHPASVHLARLRLGEATDLSGDIDIPRRPDDPWAARLAGRSVDASAQFSHDQTSGASDEAAPPGPPWKIQANFDRIVLGKDGRELHGVALDAESDGTTIRRGVLTGKTVNKTAFHATIEPRPGSRHLTVETMDAGGLLRAAGVVDDMRGGKLSILGTFNDKAADHALQGSAEVTDFRMHNTPALAKLLQIMTFYGLVDVLQGPGLGFSRLVAPFRKTGETLELTDARAFSASLGLTAKGKIDLARRQMAVEGTIVPAYFFNTLLGNIPLIGRLFSPEQGGGVFAATYSMRGSLDDPEVRVNPLAALTPGFLRGLFGIFDQAPAPDTK